MNKDYLLLKNLYGLLEAGYSIEEALRLCQQMIHYHVIDEMLEQLNHGESIENILLNSSLPHLFCEYFRFFQNKNCLSEAIKKSLDICIMKEEYQNKLKSKLTYPSILVTFLFLFSLFVVFMLLPNVNQLFSSFQIEKSFHIEILFGFFYFIPSFIIGAVFIALYLVLRLIYALKHKLYRIIEMYLKWPIFKLILQKYFSLKFALYFHELLSEDIDSTSVISILNEQMTDSDLKIILYEINNRLYGGENLEEILEDFEYFDDLFISFFQMYMKNPQQRHSLSYYIQVTYEYLDYCIERFLKYLIPMIYGFVALFVITIYIAIIIPMMNSISNI